MSERRDVVRRSDDLDTALEEVDVEAALRGLARMGRRNRLMIWGLAASLLLDLLLSVAVWRIAVGAGHSAHEAASAQTAARNQCLSGNEARAGQLQLWDYVLTISAQSPPPQPLTAEQERQRQHQVEDFRGYINRLFAPRDCEHLAISATTTTTPRATSTTFPRGER